ncbi:M16 family metallopeptidase [Neisseria animalis]|uniref:Insulinase family protein n=1 Tax=Neisseria animalis TaxID=492 RepID=A0A5P3MU17_NEIAN|nr:pitrilysin family protein [Neisseria animalis]QEY24990.1 insulinase family protein [Neisseria animalis]ROW32596.1 insulinase family protein [Neisseria animalis]VEE06112.1 protease3 [Neisseria animalis]
MLRSLFVLSLAFALPAWAQTLSHTLPNGLKVIVKEDRRAPVAVAQLWYKVGSIDEQPGKSGLSHALEHMMFKGTPNVPSGVFNRTVSALGGKNNAYTNRSETVYYENIAAANLPEVLALEADRMQNLNFSNDEFLNEMSVIREERRQRTEDSAAGKLWEHIYLNSFTKPSMRAAVIGYMDDLHTLTAEDLRNWYRQYYAPNNAVLVVVGDVDAARTIQTASELFGGIPAKDTPPRNDLTEPAERAPAYTETTSAVTRQPLIALSYRVPPLKQLDDNIPYALDVLADILAGNSSSRFDSRLVRGKQSALSVGASYDLLSREMPLFNITAMPAEEVSEHALIDQIRAEIRDIAENGIGKDELSRVQKRAYADEIYARDSMSAQASLMGRLETRGFRYTDEAEIRRRLQAVRPSDIQAAAKLLTDNRSGVVVVKPEHR